MLNAFSRTELLIGPEAMTKLKNSRVIVFGVGGVGGYTVEALARSGVGAIDVVDNDKVCLTNINRQIVATRKTLGKYKVTAAAERIAEINPDCKVTPHRMFFLPDTADKINFADFDYVVDAIDTVSGKIAIIEKAKAAGVPVISCMSAGNKLDATAFTVADIADTSVCPLAKVMRRELKRRNISGVKVVYSKEDPARGYYKEGRRAIVPASCAFVPSVAGLILAGEVIKDLTIKAKKK
ncbi:MAG: tRNA threonylcarbamoyladenosine dehydratase [Clostridia bacterium]|nr:tRNA threonylcarbamoyladenosine dehydratase [Clostridia bacterium]